MDLEIKVDGGRRKFVGHRTALARPACMPLPTLGRDIGTKAFWQLRAFKRRHIKKEVQIRERKIKKFVFQKHKLINRKVHECFCLLDSTYHGT